jgi:hypothetical protein
VNRAVDDGNLWRLLRRFLTLCATWISITRARRGSTPSADVDGGWE